jgi:hypothetical protein
MKAVKVQGRLWRAAHTSRAVVRVRFPRSGTISEDLTERPLPTSVQSDDCADCDENRVCYSHCPRLVGSTPA